MNTDDITFENFPYEPKWSFEAAKQSAIRDYDNYPDDLNQTGRIEAAISSYQQGVRFCERYLKEGLK